MTKWNHNETIGAHYSHSEVLYSIRKHMNRDCAERHKQTNERINSRKDIQTKSKRERELIIFL